MKEQETEILDIYNEIKKMLSQNYSFDESSITLKTSFMDDIGLSSLDLINLMVVVENTYGLEVDETAVNLVTVGDVLKYISKLKTNLPDDKIDDLIAKLI